MPLRKINRLISIKALNENKMSENQVYKELYKQSKKKQD